MLACPERMLDQFTNRLLPQRYRSRKRRAGRSRDPSRVARRLGIEPLEARVLLSAVRNSFAHFMGSLTAATDVDSIRVQIDPADFTMPRQRVTMGFLARASDGSPLDLGEIDVVPQGQAAASLVQQHTNTADDSA